VLNDHERKSLREVERQFQVEDPEFTRSFDTRAQRLRRRPAESGRAALITPIADRLRKVDMQIITQPVPAQDGITRDNVTVRVDAVLYQVVDPVRVAVDVQDYRAAILQIAGWGVHIDPVEIKDVALPESMNRSMSRQAEAERERGSRVINAEGELQASRKLAEAAEVMTEHPAALQLRLLQTVVKVAAEKNSTLVLPFPVELLRFLERASPAATPDTAIPATTAPMPPSGPPAATSTGPEPAAATGAWENDAVGTGRAHPAAPRAATVAQGAEQR
jgi:hypothetical protein